MSDVVPALSLVVTSPGSLPESFVRAIGEQALDAHRFEVISSLAQARGKWVAFPDAGDVLNADHLAEVADLIDTDPSINFIAPNGNPISDAFFKAEHLEGLELDAKADVGAFCWQYLSTLGNPEIGYVGAANHSSSQRHVDSLADYLALLQQATKQSKAVPTWLQSFILHELTWHFTSQDKFAEAPVGVSGQQADEFHALVRQIRAYLDDGLVEANTSPPAKLAIRQILQHSYSAEPWHTEYAVADRWDVDAGLTRIWYNYTGEAPTETITAASQTIAPAYSKVRDISYHDRALLHQRILWLPSQHAPTINLDGKAVNLRFNADGSGKAAVPGVPLAEQAPAITVTRKRGDRWTWRDRATVRLARLTKRYRDAWVLMDRVHTGDDNADRLFRYLRAERPDINAWFVIEKGTTDWNRLRRDGHRKRVIAYGSLRWKLLMGNSKHVVSSHVEAAIIRPPVVTRLFPPTWRTTFLNHGVIKDDLSGWLNPRLFDIFITSTEGEYHSVMADGSPYVHTTKEAKLTGLSRFDRLREIGARVPPEKRKYVLIAPTWRHWLLEPYAAGSDARPAKAGLMESDFMRNWLGVLRSDALRAACERHGVVIGFLPHPNLQPVLDQMDLPDHIQALTYDNDVQELFAQAAVFVTDYSSIAFNCAYIDRPVVYFQFDQAEVLGGAHIGRAGYFKYEEVGYGPVAYDIDAAVSAIIESLDHGRDPAPEYQRRITEAFPVRDGRCCERVTKVIEESALPYELS